MINDNEPRIFANHWEAERAHAEMELRAFERERAIEDIVRLIRRFEITPQDIVDAMGGAWRPPSETTISLYEPYFGAR